MNPSVAHNMGTSATCMDTKHIQVIVRKHKTYSPRASWDNRRPCYFYRTFLYILSDLQDLKWNDVMTLHIKMTLYLLDGEYARSDPLKTEVSSFTRNVKLVEDGECWLYDFAENLSDSEIVERTMNHIAYCVKKEFFDNADSSDGRRVKIEEELREKKTVDEKEFIEKFNVCFKLACQDIHQVIDAMNHKLTDEQMCVWTQIAEHAKIPFQQNPRHCVIS